MLALQCSWVIQTNLVAVLNYHKFHSLKQHSFVILMFPWVRSVGLMWLTCALRSISQGLSQDVGRPGLLLGAAGRREDLILGLFMLLIEFNSV